MKERLPTIVAALGIVGSLACTVAMAVALAGLLGAGAGVAASGAIGGGMAGMGNGPSNPATESPSPSLPAPLVSGLLLLIQSGPVILILSIAAIAIGVGLRRRSALLLVIMAGLVLYWAMYLQTARLIMSIGAAIGLAALIAAYFWSTRLTSTGT